jgi:catechol 2,3-dioxygenase-like lactoylglutathione lyase family enzyme
VIKLTATVLDTPDPRGLARFYRDLLGWEIGDDDAGWVTLRPSDGGAGLSFQAEPKHTRPVWPAQDGEPLMQAHLDIQVDDLETESARAEQLGAVRADHQPQEHVRVFFDPAGHPFCLYTNE